MSALRFEIFFLLIIKNSFTSKRSSYAVKEVSGGGGTKWYNGRMLDWCTFCCFYNDDGDI